MNPLSDRLLVSILIPCKNADRFLDECISSIIAQTYTSWELIIVDDHSTDQSLQVMQKWANEYSNIKILRNKGTGIIKALQLAYSQSIGALITRMDADDIMTTAKLDIMVSQLLTSGLGSIATGMVEYFRDDLPIGQGYLKYAEWLNSLSLHGSNFDDIYKECVIASPCWMMYREDFDAIGAFHSEIYPEDYDLVFRMYKHKLHIIPCTTTILHQWRDHGHRASRNDENYKDNRFLELKVRYFLELDYNTDHSLVIWGAGTKAKRIAKQLIASEVAFYWITDNEKKIGHDIYGIILSPTTILAGISNAQIIIAVANPQQQEEIRKDIKSLESTHMYHSYWFC